MKSTFVQSKYHRLFSLLAVSCLLFISTASSAQEARSYDGEKATCKITANNKTYQPLLNQIGYFDRVSNIQPLAKIPVEVTYPDAQKGEKVVLEATDGGQFEGNKKVMVIQLDKQKKCSFTFQVSNDPGIFTITLRKGNDTKVVQLWVGEDPSLSNN